MCHDVYLKTSDQQKRRMQTYRAFTKQSILFARTMRRCFDRSHAADAVTVRTPRVASAATAGFKHKFHECLDLSRQVCLKLGSPIVKQRQFWWAYRTVT